MLEKLFNSSTRVKILELFFENKNCSFYTQEVIKKTNTDPANTHRELKKLVYLNVLLVKRARQKVYYSLNIKSPYYWALSELFKTHAQNDTDDSWVVLEEMPNYYPMMVAIVWNVEGANKIFKNFGLTSRFTKLLTIYKNDMCSLAVVKKEFNFIANEVLKILINRPAIGKKYISRLTRCQNELILETDKLRRVNLADLTNRRLYSLYKKYYEVYSKLHAHHWIQTTADFEDNILSKYLMNYLASRIHGHKQSLGEYFSVMTTPVEDGNGAKENKDLLEILHFINQNKTLKIYFQKTESRIIAQELDKINKSISMKIKKHVDKYGWIGYGTIGPGWDSRYFIDILCSLLRQNVNPIKTLKKLQQDKENLKKMQSVLEKKLKIDNQHKELFAMARAIIYTKGTRKDSMFYSYSVIENLFREIGRRYFLSIKQMRFMYPFEFKRLLLDNKYSAAELNERIKLSLHYSISKPERDYLLEGDKADRFIKSLHFITKELSDTKILNGDCASPGRVRGKVAIVNVPGDMPKVKPNDVLVSIATNPDLIPAIKKSAAIITDVGGITCHAAIVSRELSIPCVIGTKIATKVLQNGDVVDVDATHGKITIIKKQQ